MVMKVRIVDYKGAPGSKQFLDLDKNGIYRYINRNAGT